MGRHAGCRQRLRSPAVGRQRPLPGGPLAQRQVLPGADGDSGPRSLEGVAGDEGAPDTRRWSVMDPRFDEAVVVERSSNGTSIFIGRVGELVVWQAANCGVDLADHLDLFAQAMVLE